jgi:hypothetical protein
MAGYMGQAVSLYPGETNTIAPISGWATTVIQIGGSSNGAVAPAAGGNLLYSYAFEKETGITGTLRAIRANATTTVASSGTLIGVEGRAGNGTSASATDGVNVGTCRGGYFYVAGSGSSATITTAEALRAHLDIDATGLTVTTAYGIRINCQTGNATVSTLYGLMIEHEAATGTADTMTAAIAVKCVNGNEPMTCLIDASGCGAIGSGDTYNLFKLPSGSGKTYLRWDISDSAWSQTS